MKKNTTIVIITLIHVTVSCSVFIVSFSSGMSRFDSGDPASLCEQITNVTSMVLLWPIFYPIAMWAGNIFSGVSGYIPLLINSFVWALAIYWLIKKFKKK